MKTNSPFHRPARSGFTLVELLVAITVVAILVGMLSAAVIPAFKRAREATVQMEMKQIELSIENFKNQYGFYPPNFEALAGPADLLRYVNRMSPNHAELSPSGHGTESRLEHWWEMVGAYLDKESSLVFWLSGTCKNKQYPITGGWRDENIPLAAHNFNPQPINQATGNVDSVNGTLVERDVFFEFKGDQMFGDDPDEIVRDKMSNNLPTDQQGYILDYQMAHGATSGDKTYKYSDAPSYLTIGAYTDAGGNFLNPNSFQLVTFGLDGEPGAAGSVFTAGSKADDNLVNFADGRLDKYVNSNQ